MAFDKTLEVDRSGGAGKKARRLVTCDGIRCHHDMSRIENHAPRTLVQNRGVPCCGPRESGKCL